MSEETKRFLDHLWGNKDPDRGYILIWSAKSSKIGLKNKRSDFCLTIEHALQIIGDLPEENEIYIGVGLRNEIPKKGRRGGKESIIAIAGMWADVDFADPVHQKQNLPPTLEEAIELVEAPFNPSITIHSGHGIQSWWAFKEPWYFQNEKEKENFCRSQKSWQGYLLRKAKEKKWIIDSTWDVARVLRIPGTINSKGGDCIPVRILSEDSKRYTSWQDFEIDDPIVSDVWAGSQREDIILDEDRAPPIKKFESLMVSDQRFERSWEHKRRDLDTSHSGYELSLAAIAARAEWSDQEIADLIIFHRQKWNPENIKKCLRRDYIEKTIEIARRGISDNLSEKDTIQQGLEVINGDQDPDDIKKILGEKLGNIEIESFTREGDGDEGIFFLKIKGKDKRICLGDRVKLNSFTTTSMILRDETPNHTRPPAMKPKQWIKVVDMLYRIVEESDFPEDLEDWLNLYLAEHKPGGEEEWKNCFARREPYLKEGMVFINEPAFREFVRIRFDPRIKKVEMRIKLKHGGFENTKESARISGRETPLSQRYWKIPIDDLGMIPEIESKIDKENEDEFRRD